MGNMLALELGTSRTATFSYSGTTPKLTGVTENGVPRSVTYDAAGNETAVGSVTSTYSPRNYFESSGGISYVYDGRGVRTIARTAPPAGTLSSLTISPASVEGGNPSVGTVTLTGPTPPGGVVVSLTSLDPTKASVPSTVTVAGGRRGDSAGFVITTFAVTSPDSVTIEASAGGETRTATLQLLPAGSGRSLPLESSATGLPLQSTADTPARVFSFYTPELNLLAETELSASSTPTVVHEYIWFAGRPVAQIAPQTGTIRWTFTDHLGTPLLLTRSDRTIFWRAEHEPYGRIFAMRSGDQHQPLRLPGQEAEQLSSIGGNGDTERSYNIYRWYRAGAGRYTQSDPIGMEGGPNPYMYGSMNPITFIDRYGLKAELVCAEISLLGLSWSPFLHCRIRVTCEKCEGGNFGGPYDTSVGLERNRKTGKLDIMEFPISESYGDSFPIEGVNQKDSCQFGRCVRAHSAAFDKKNKAADWEEAYGLLGPNSNTYAAMLINICGGWIEFPPGAVGGNAPPFDY